MEGEPKGCTQHECASDTAPVKQEDRPTRLTAHPAAKSVHPPPACEAHVLGLRNYTREVQICGHALHSLRAPGNSAQCPYLSSASDRGGSGEGGDMRLWPWPPAPTQDQSSHLVGTTDLWVRALREAVFLHVRLQRASVHRGALNL